MKPLAGRVALVTGAASGIGAATALRLGRDGAAVVLVDLDADGAERVAAELRADGEADVDAFDVTDEPGWERAVDRVLQRRGRLDVVVNAAGIAHGAPLTDLALADWERVLRVDLTSCFLGTKHALRAMKDTGVGCVVNVASTSGLRAAPGAAAYSVAKAGVIMLSRCAALEAAQWGGRIRVVTVAPGGTVTPIWSQLPGWADMVRQAGSEEAVLAAFAGHVPLKRYADPEEIAGAIAYVAGDEAAYVTGTELVIDGGWSIG